MRDLSSRSGFTLVELMTATVVSTLVIVSVFSAFIGGQRLLRMTMARTEMSLRTRELRDKLLFHAAPTHDNTVWAGILSGTKQLDKSSVVEGNGYKILMKTDALQGERSFSGETANQQMEIRLENQNAKNCWLFSEDRYDERWDFRWLHPGNLNLFAANNAQSAPVIDGSRLATDNLLFIHVTGRMDAAGSVVEHNERIVVPLFGAKQRSLTDGKGGL